MHNDTVDERLAKQFRNVAIRHRNLLMHSVRKTALHRAQHMLLMTVARLEGESQRALAKEMEISTAAITVALKKLEKLGYIGREVDEHDNRFNCIYTTAAGKQLVEESRSIFHKIDQAVFDGFTEEEKQQLVGYYERVLKNIERMEQCACSYEKGETQE